MEVRKNIYFKQRNRRKNIKKYLLQKYMKGRQAINFKNPIKNQKNLWNKDKVMDRFNSSLSIMHISDIHRSLNSSRSNTEIISSLKADHDIYLSSSIKPKPIKGIICSGDIVLPMELFILTMIFYLNEKNSKLMLLYTSFYI